MTLRWIVRVFGAVAGVAGALLLGAPAPGHAASSSVAGYICQGAQLTLFDNTTSGDVQNGGAPAMFSTNGKAYCVTYIQTYHWNGGQGSAPGGFVGIRYVSGPGNLDNGSVSFTAQTSSGQDGAPNVNWFADVPIAPKPVIVDGTYQCKDSAPGTWSSDQQSAGAGFCIIYADPAVPGPTPSSTAATSTGSPPPSQSVAPSGQGVASSGSGGSPLVPVGIAVAALAVAAGGVLIVTRANQVEDYFHDCGDLQFDCSGRLLPWAKPPPYPPIPMPGDWSGGDDPPPLPPIDPPSEPVPPIAGDSSGPPDDVM